MEFKSLFIIAILNKGSEMSRISEIYLVVLSNAVNLSLLYYYSSPFTKYKIFSVDFKTPVSPFNSKYLI